MKVAFFNDTYRPYMSGVITSMDRFAAALEGKGHEVVLVVPGQWAPPWRKEQDETVHELPSIPVPGFDGLRIGTPILGDSHLSIAENIDANVDLVHAHSPFILGRMGARLAEKRDLPLVFTCHSIYPQYSDYLPLMSELAADVLRDYVADFCTRCNLVLAPSRHARDKLLQWGVTTPIEVLPSGVEVDVLRKTKEQFAEHPSEVRASLCSPLGIDEGSTLLLYVGRLDRQKNITFLFEVVKGLDDLQAELIVVGNGPAYSNIKEAAEESGAGERVHFVGKLPFDEVIMWYCAADVFCFPSVAETQGLVLVEAMAVGLPTVALDSPTSQEILSDGDSGLLSRNSVSEFSECIARLLEDEQLYTRISHSSQQKAREFSIDSLTCRLIEFYRRAVSNR